MSDSKVAAALDEIRERYKTSFTTLPAEGWTHISSADDIPRLLAALDEVLAHHEPSESRHGSVCVNCLDAYGEHVEWPCETHQAISRALLGEDGSNEH